MRESISLKQFIVSCIINVLNSFFYFLAYNVTLNYRFLVFLTILTLDFNSIYLFLSFICDISLFVFKSTKLEVLNDFMRNKICHIANPISYIVTILFWSLALFGGMGDIVGNVLFAVLNIYAHLLITIFVIIDIFIAEHENHTFSKIILAIIYIYMILYGILCGVLTLKFDSPPYPFLKGISIWGLLAYYSVFLVVTFLCYLLHLFIFKIKFKYIVKEDNSSQLREEINKIEGANE